MMSKGQSTDPRFFTAASLKALLEAAGVFKKNSRMHPLNDVGLKELAVTLEIQRTLNALEKSGAENKAMMGELHSATLTIRRLGSKIAEQSPPAKRAALERLVQATVDPDAVIIPHQIFAGEPMESHKQWHEIAYFLEVEFLKAVRATNPNSRLGRAENGPAMIFLSATLPHITGEGPTSAAIKAFLNRKHPRA